MNCWAAYFYQRMIDEKVVDTSCSVEMSLCSSNMTLLNSPGLLKFCSSCFSRCVCLPLRFLYKVLNFDKVVRAGWLPQHAKKLRSQRCARAAVTVLNNLIRCHGPGSSFQRSARLSDFHCALACLAHSWSPHRLFSWRPCRDAVHPSVTTINWSWAYLGKPMFKTSDDLM